MDSANSKQKRSIFWELVFWVLFVYTVYICVFHFVPYPKAIWIGAISGIVALLFAAVKTYTVMGTELEDTKISEIEAYARKSVKSLLLRKYGILLIPVLFLFALIWKFISIQTAICFICGSICSMLAGFAGVNIITKANARTAQCRYTNATGAFKTAFAAGTVIGMIITGLGLLALSVLFIIFKDPDMISGFVLGGCFVALFVCAESKTKKDSAEKTEENVFKLSDIMGITVAGADLFTTYIVSILAAITLGAASLAFKGAILPIVISGFAVFASIFAINLVRIKKESNSVISLRFASCIAIILTLIASYFIIKLWMPMFFGIFWAILIGALAGCLIRLSNGYYTCARRKPLKNTVQSLETGITHGIISTLKVGAISTTVPALIICIVITGAFWAVGGFENFGFGVYGVAIASVAMLSVTSIIAAGNAYALIYTSANKITETEEEVKECTGKPLSIITADSKGFAVASSALSALALLYAYISTAGIETIDLLDPRLVSSLLFGACLPFAFLALSVGSAKHGASKKIEVLIAIVTPLLIGIFAGAHALSAMLFGAIASGACLAIMTANSINVWNSAKKCIEKGKLKSENLADEGSALGGHLKDTLAASINILTKLMVIVSLVCVTLFIQAGK